MTDIDAPSKPVDATRLVFPPVWSIHSCSTEK